MMRRAALFLVLLCAPGLASLAAEGVDEPTAYRTENYRSPTPATLSGARVVTTEQAAELWRNRRALFIDVMPKPIKPELPAGTVWREPVRLDIPGSVWLPDTGYGTLSEEMAGWFSQKLADATGNDKTRPVLFYCETGCWMSWNAGKRALEWGYSSVIWYPEGAGGWKAAALPLEERAPVPRPGELTSAGSPQ